MATVKEAWHTARLVAQLAALLLGLIVQCAGKIPDGEDGCKDGGIVPPVVCKHPKVPSSDKKTCVCPPGELSVQYGHVMFTDWCAALCQRQQ